ncbi:MAG: hypothetical protein GEU89_21375, partial [Kiloniellaceae bacterium]|nr:hypothetical protein [Kiloniellaceae bacterium]
MRVAKRRGRMLPVAMLATIACLAATGVWFAAGGDDGEPVRDPQRTQASSRIVTTRPGSSSEQQAPDTPPTDGVVLPEGASEVDGYPVQFPYTDLGAVAAQAAVSRAQVGFDYDQAAAVAGIYAAPADRPVLEQRAREAVALR